MQKSENKKQDICNKLYEIKQILRALGSLFEQQVRNPSYDEDILCGIGVLLILLSDDLNIVEEYVRISIKTED